MVLYVYKPCCLVVKGYCGAGLLGPLSIRVIIRYMSWIPVAKLVLNLDLLTWLFRPHATLQILRFHFGLNNVVML